MKRLVGVALLCSAGVNFGQTALTYQKPPAAIEALLDAPPTPVVRISPDRTLLLVEQPQTFPTIAEVAEPRYRLAGIRFNPKVSGPSAEGSSVGLSLQAVAGGGVKAISGLPVELRATNMMWSPNSRYVAFVQREDNAARVGGAGLYLYVIDVATAHARRLGTVHLNAILGRGPCEWMPDSTALLCKTIPLARGAAPKESEVPTGPNVSENLGKASPAPTYEDMLKTPQDENIFEFYARSQLAVLPLSGPMRTLPVKGLVTTAMPSPDGRCVLVQMLHRPFSYTFPLQRFPLKTEILTLKSGTVKDIDDRPLVDNLPISRDAVATGPRSFQWRSDAAATLVWVEAADGGLPNLKNTVWDRVMALDTPFDGKPSVMLESALRINGQGGGQSGGLYWGGAHLAVASESRFSDRKQMIVTFDPSTPGKVAVLYTGSSQDRYRSPGLPVTSMNASGHPQLRLTSDGSGIYFFSPGASPAGDRPFVGVMPVGGGTEKILVRSSDPYFDQPLALLSDDAVLIRRESATQSPNYFSLSLKGSGDPVQVTKFASPFAGIQMPTKQMLKYKRADGVDLTATLWTPAGYDKSQGPLPTLLEAYPAEFKTRSAASQVAGSPNRFPNFGWGGSAVYFAQAGYAVLENAAIPIIGEGSAEPNDTYVGQLVAGATAAVDYGVSLGVVDRNRVGVMGHSYGAFMTANLLANTGIFRAGIARSGAYNRTLTPFGFQNEERTYWQAPEVYFKMSPFSYADKIKTPLLMIHGEADDNTGTYPIQSERFFAALKGQGATVRLVFLPLEPHHYGAHESLQHMLWEMTRWLDTYVKPLSPVPSAAAVPQK